MGLSLLITPSAVYKEAKSLAQSKGKAKSFELTHRYLTKRNNEFYKYLKDRSNLEAFCDSLTNYEISSYKGFALTKGVDSNGRVKYRPLLIPDHSDRLLFSIVNKILFPLFEDHMKKFHCFGIGLKENGKKISAGPVIKELIALNEAEYTHVLKTDFKRFFCTIPRGRLLHKIKPFLRNHPEGDVLFELIKQSLYNDITSDGIFESEFSSWQLHLRGVPQGLSYSSLLASFYGTILDGAISDVPGVKHKRYLDDMVILSDSKENLEIAYTKLKQVSTKIGLDLHDIGPVSDGKTFVVDSNREAYIFIGVEVRDGKALVPKKAVKRFKQVIEQEIINADTIEQYSPYQIKEIFDNYTYGWKRAYSSVVSPHHYNEVIHLLNEYLEKYLSTKRKRPLTGISFRL